MVKKIQGNFGKKPSSVLEQVSSAVLHLVYSGVTSDFSMVKVLHCPFSGGLKLFPRLPWIRLLFPVLCWIIPIFADQKRETVTNDIVLVFPCLLTTYCVGL